MVATRASATGRVPDIDLDIFRELYGGGGVSSLGFDPRLTSSEVARRLKVSRARVAARLAEWSETGLLRGYDVWPNPALLDQDVASVDLRVHDRLEKESLYERLGLVDGVLGGMDLLGPWASVQLVGRNREEIERRADLLRGLTNVAEVTSPLHWVRLEPRRELSPLDLRIVRVLRRYPTETLAKVAKIVGVSTRTITTRYGRLLDERAVWFVPLLDFRALPMPVLNVHVQLSDPAEHDGVARAVRRRYPQSLEYVRLPWGPPFPSSFAVFIVLPGSAAAVEQVERDVRSLRGVGSVEVYTMVRMHSYPASFDRLLEEPEPVRVGRRAVPAEASV